MSLHISRQSKEISSMPTRDWLRNKVAPLGQPATDARSPAHWKKSHRSKRWQLQRKAAQNWNFTKLTEISILWRTKAVSMQKSKVWLKSTRKLFRKFLFAQCLPSASKFLKKRKGPTSWWRLRTFLLYTRIFNPISWAPTLKRGYSFTFPQAAERITWSSKRELPQLPPWAAMAQHPETHERVAQGQKFWKLILKTRGEMLPRWWTPPRW